MTTTPDNWIVSTTGVLRAHFKQPTGPSRAGADWKVTLSNGNERHGLFVRTYVDTVGKLNDADESRVVVDYVTNLLRSGWSPAQYSGQPGELVVEPPDGAAAPATKRAWWKFWER